MLLLTANEPSVSWDNHSADDAWISWWLPNAGFSTLWFPVAPRLWPCHYRLLVFAIMPCLLLSFPSAVARCLCNTTQDAWSSALLSRWEKSICPISSRLALSNSSIPFLSSLSGTCSWSFLLVRVSSGSPFMVTNYYGYQSAHKPKKQLGLSLKLILYETLCSETQYTEAAAWCVWI